LSRHTQDDLCFILSLRFVPPSLSVSNLDLSITVPFILLSILIATGLHFVPSQSQSCFRYLS
ncbi:unnamed protein product, partial [Arabidopsis halleri]